MPQYNPHAIEEKWQQFWLKNKVFASVADPTSPKFYVLDMFPYPSGEGLHVGHPEGYTASDIVARYKRACGFSVMHPMGWDAFGLPAEQYAIKTDTHPAATTRKNVSRFRSQLQALGFSYDWEREINTTDPEYYRWTQWIFLQLFDTWFDESSGHGRPIAELAAEFASGRRAVPGCTQSWHELDARHQREILAGFRLAYQADVAVNWCPGLGTVLANEEVIDGKSEVGGFPVERRPMRQWMLRITAYSRRLLDGLDTLEWSESLKMMQRNWIGRSEGALVHFQITGRTEILDVFTTRPDTLYGVSYMVLAPEHPLVNVDEKNCIIPPTWPEHTPAGWKYAGAPESPALSVQAYQKWVAGRSERQRQEDTSKTGVFTGAYAINPVNQQRIAIFVSDYVLMGYGTGAIMAVPAHDRRDFDFARKFGLPMERVVSARSDLPEAGELPFEETGYAVHSPWINGLATEQAIPVMIQQVEERRFGLGRTHYKIRDWLFSRQRYWGEPFPLVHLEDGTTVPLAPEELPLRLPDLVDFKPTGTMDPPLSKAVDWAKVWVLLEGPPATAVARVVPPGTPGAMPARRELNTMPQWAGSCWYYLRYLDPRNPTAFCQPETERYWMKQPPGVDLYIGGVEHAVLHLLYSRFWHKVLFDRGYVSSQEPFRKLVNQGLILGEAEYTAFSTSTGDLVSWSEVAPELSTRTGADGRPEIVSRHKSTGELLVGRAPAPATIEKRGSQYVLKSRPDIEVDARSYKMSKSRGNVINPDDVIAKYGADSLRLFEMFMGQLEQVKPWSTAGVEGVYRFLHRLWRNVFGTEEENQPRVVVKDGSTWRLLAGGALTAEQARKAQAAADELVRPMHRLVRKVTQDIERLSFNTAISTMMEFNNMLTRLEVVPREAVLTLVRLLEPFAPHVAEEIYQHLSGTASVESLSRVPWPTYDDALCVEARWEIPVQINGKVSGRVSVPADAAEDHVLQSVLADAQIQEKLAGRNPRKKIYVKGRMVSLVV